MKYRAEEDFMRQMESKKQAEQDALSLRLFHSRPSSFSINSNVPHMVAVDDQARDFMKGLKVRLDENRYLDFQELPGRWQSLLNIDGPVVDGGELLEPLKIEGCAIAAVWVKDETTFSDDVPIKRIIEVELGGAFILN